MQQALELIQDSDLFPLLLLSLILYFVGSTMTESNEALRKWGWRMAAAAFIAYGLYSGLIQDTATAPDWLHIAFRALLAGGFALGVAWIGLSTIAFVVGGLMALARSPIHAVNAARDRHRQRNQRRLQDEAQLRRAREDARRSAEHAQQTATQAEAKRRRTDARARAALTYSLFAAKLQSHFTPPMFDNFVATYMNDDQAAEDVERRGEELLQTLQKHLETVDPPEKKRTLADLAAWFLQQKERIQSLPLDDKVKRVHLAELTARYAELSSRLMEKLQP